MKFCAFYAWQTFTELQLQKAKKNEKKKKKANVFLNHKSLVPGDTCDIAQKRSNWNMTL